MNMFKEKLGKKPTTIFHLRAGSSFFFGTVPPKLHCKNRGCRKRHQKPQQMSPGIFLVSRQEKMISHSRSLVTGKNRYFFGLKLCSPGYDEMPTQLFFQKSNEYQKWPYLKATYILNGPSFWPCR